MGGYLKNDHDEYLGRLSVAIRLFPHENRALELLAEMAQFVVDATSATSRMMGSPVSDHEEVFQQALEIEGHSTDHFFALMTTVRSAFVLPLPRADLYQLAQRLNQATESLTSATNIIKIHGLDRFSSRASDLLDLLQRQASLTTEAMRHLSDLEGLDEYWVEVLRMSKQSIRTTDLYQADMMDRLKPASYIKEAQFTEKLQSASLSVRQVATDVGRILVQES